MTHGSEESPKTAAIAKEENKTLEILLLPEISLLPQISFKTTFPDLLREQGRMPGMGSAVGFAPIKNMVNDKQAGRCATVRGETKTLINQSKRC